MNKEILIEYIETEYSQRRRELSDLIGLLKVEKEEKYIEILVSTGIVMLFSHIQGFIENTLIQIEKFIIESEIPFNDLCSDLKFQCIKNSSNSHYDLIQLVLRGGLTNKKIKIFQTNAYGNIIFGNSNLKSTNGLDSSILFEIMNIFSIKEDNLFNNISFDYLTISFLRNANIGSKNPSIDLNDYKKNFFIELFDSFLKDKRNIIVHGKSKELKHFINTRNHTIIDLYNQEKSLDLKGVYILQELYFILVLCIYDNFLDKLKTEILDYLNKEKYK